jgi:hypothetical protein
MPRRRPGAVPAKAAAAEQRPDHTGEPDFTPVSVDSLQQVLDALRRLN